MKHTINKKAADVNADIFNYVYDYMASLTDRDRQNGDPRPNEPIEIDRSKIQILADPSKNEKVPADKLFDTMNQKPIFVKFAGSDQIVAFAKRGNEILSGRDLVNTYAAEDRKAQEKNPNRRPVEDPGVIPEPGRWARFLKRVFNYSTRAMKEYEVKIIQKDAFERQQVRNESVRLSGNIAKMAWKEAFRRELRREVVETCRSLKRQ